MANVLTDLAADLYKAADIVAREQIGAIPSVIINGGAEGAAVGQTVRSHVTRESTVVNVTPSMTIPEGTDQTVDNKTMTLTKQRGVAIPWTGEEMKFVNSGSGFETIYGDQIMQAMRKLANEAEVDLVTEIYRNASRAHGTAGTTPFASNFNEVAEIRQILVDNGMPQDREASLIINSLAGTKLRNLAQLQKSNENGSDEMLRQGTLLDLQGLMFKESAGIQSHTAGTVTGTVTVTGANAVGATTINVTTAAGAAVALVAGDVVTFAGDTNKYIVASASTIGASTTGNIVIASPGLRQATAGSEAVTAGASYTGNIAFHRQAAEIAFRAPAKPAGGDAAVDVMTIQDPLSGMVFEVAAYKGFNKAMFYVSSVWGVKAWKPDFIANLLG